MKKIKAFWNFVRGKNNILKELERGSKKLNESIIDLRKSSKDFQSSIDQADRKIKKLQRRLKEQVKFLKDKGWDKNQILKDEKTRSLLKSILMQKKIKTGYGNLKGINDNSIIKIKKSKTLIDKVISAKRLERTNKVLKKYLASRKNKSKKVTRSFITKNEKHQSVEHENMGVELSKFGQSPSKTNNEIIKNRSKREKNIPKLANPIIGKGPVRY